MDMLCGVSGLARASSRALYGSLHDRQQCVLGQYQTAAGGVSVSSGFRLKGLALRISWNPTLTSRLHSPILRVPCWWRLCYLTPRPLESSGAGFWT